MSFQHDDYSHQQKKIIRSNKEYKINGVRPTALQLHKSSHVIHKSSASSSSSVSTACSYTSPSNKNHQRNGPVIIYTHSPKVIHTQPRDFMALVQKLTGLSASFEQTHQREMAPPIMPVVESACEGERSDNEMGCGVVQDLNLDYGLSRNKFDKNDNRSFLSEIPLFTPTAFDTFTSPPAHQQQQFRFPGDPIFSPATLEFLKLLPEC
ncbi:unnamed protein product [Rhodiola kirilowii]